ncbi:uncharacterized protein LOC111407783 isoform X3 [Olea europaea var. sylvestris]|nr:uncharacterized protein LOC111407783 isoform X3 [Olea europaea var. sylvestris]
MMLLVQFKFEKFYLAHLEETINKEPSLFLLKSATEVASYFHSSAWKPFQEHKEPPISSGSSASCCKNSIISFDFESSVSSQWLLSGSLDSEKSVMGKVHGSLARAGKVREQTPKVVKQDKKKKPRGRAHKRMQYNRRFVTAVVGFGMKKSPNSSTKFLTTDEGRSKVRNSLTPVVAQLALQKILPFPCNEQYTVAILMPQASRLKSPKSFVRSMPIQYCRDAKIFAAIADFAILALSLWKRSRSALKSF